MKKTVIVLLLVTALNLHAQTVIQGIIAQNRTLTKAESPYNFGKVLVPENVVLSIEPGVTINILFPETEHGSYSNKNQLLIEGTLIAKGSADALITINGNLKIGYDPTMGGKRPEKLQEKSVLEYCLITETISNALDTYNVPIDIKNSVIKGRIYLAMSKNPLDNNISELSNTIINSRISASNGKININNCIIYGREHAIHQSEVTLNNSIIDGKETESTRYGFMIVGPKVTITNNIFRNQQTDALCIYPNTKNKYTVTNNSFYNNQTNIRLDVVSIPSGKLIEYLGANCKIENNDLFTPIHKQIIVNDHDARNAKGEFVVMDLKNNFWDSVSENDINNYITDNRTDYQQRLKISINPILENAIDQSKINNESESKPVKEIREEKEVIPYEYPVYFFDDAPPKQDTESYLEYVFDNHHYTLPLVKITEEELMYAINNLSQLTPEQLGYVTIKKKDKYYKPSFTTSAAFDTKKENLLAVWNFTFMNLNFNTIKLPHAVSKTFVQKKPYFIATFTNNKTTTTNIEVTITRTDNDFMYGTVKGIYFTLNKEKKSIDGTFKFRLN